MRRTPSNPLLLARWLASSWRGGKTGWENYRGVAELGPFRLEPDHIARYLRATKGVDLTFLGEGLVPPTYAALLETAAGFEILRRAGVPVPRRGLVHLESERLILRPLRLDAAPRLSAEMEGVEPHPRGTRITLVARLRGQGDRSCSESRSVLLLRGDGERSAEPRAGGGEEEGEWSPLVTWRLGAVQGRRYARASGDFNPVHLWRWTARAFGYDAPILQGFCLEAMVAHALLRERLNGDVRALTRLSIRFRAPVRLPGAHRLEVRDDGAPRFRVVGEEGGRVLASGGWGG